MIENNQKVKTDIDGGTYPSEQSQNDKQIEVQQEENHDVHETKSMINEEKPKKKPKCKDVEIRTIKFSINPWVIICVLILAWFLL